MRGRTILLLYSPILKNNVKWNSNSDIAKTWVKGKGKLKLDYKYYLQKAHSTKIFEADFDAVHKDVESVRRSRVLIGYTTIRAGLTARPSTSAPRSSSTRSRRGMPSRTYARTYPPS